MVDVKKPNALLAVDPEAQKYIRDITKPFVAEMVEVLCDIARNPDVGPRDRTKAAVRVIDYHARGGSNEDAQGEGGHTANIVVVHAGNMREQDEAADQLRALMRTTVGSKQ